MEFVKQQVCIICKIDKPITFFAKSRNEGEHIDQCKQCRENKRDSKRRPYSERPNYKKVEADGSWMGAGDGWAHI